MNKKQAFSHNFKAKVIAAYGRHYTIESTDKQIYNAFVRAKKSNVVCGDWVIFQPTASHQAVIESVLARQSLVFRSDSFKEKHIAANCTQLLIVLACQTPLSDDFLTRTLIVAESENIKPLILLNKIDLPDENIRQHLAWYEHCGYCVLPLCALQSVLALKPFLQNEASLLIGQSGVGKSSILNALFEQNLRKTAPISKALKKGTHTSTHSQLYDLNANSSIIDSPGLQQLGLAHLNPAQMEHAFVEFRPFLGKCRFRNCQHQNEPDCAILKAVEQNQIPTFRYVIFQNLIAQLENKNRLKK